MGAKPGGLEATRRRKQELLANALKLGSINAGRKATDNLSHSTVYFWRTTDPAFEQAYQSVKVELEGRRKGSVNPTLARSIRKRKALFEATGRYLEKELVVLFGGAVVKE